ncbi:tryptophan--tRNA ligase [Candidatus Kaiserbacteria bacterium]|nr:tryptophan--tRNA ligase [Candidatus Kaiserbacteria bacterium]
MDKKTLLSGVKPTGQPHLGNYFGMMKPCIEMQHDYFSYLFIPDLHALMSVQNGPEMRDLILNLAIDYLGAGLDPEHTILFKQSDVPQHPELTWIFDTITTMPYLMRAHAFKDAEAKNKEITVGVFNYPMLMAADILLYDTDVVPVGQDQKQHVEFARDTALKFNNIYSETFKLPEAIIQEAVAVVPGTDGQKMSKSYKNTIPLFGSREEIQKAVMGIVTDSSGGRPKNVHAIHRLFKSEAELEPIYTQNEGNYKVLKEALAEDIDAFIAPLRERRESFAAQPEKVKEIIREGGDRAREVAEAKMKDVRQKIGVTL